MAGDDKGRREEMISGPGRETGTGEEVGGGAVPGSRSRIFSGSELQNSWSRSWNGSLPCCLAHRQCSCEKLL